MGEDHDIMIESNESERVCVGVEALNICFERRKEVQKSQAGKR